MPLFHVQDQDRPGYVVADNFEHALEKWRSAMKRENDGDVGDEPDGVAMVCDDEDLIIEYCWCRDSAISVGR